MQKIKFMLGALVLVALGACDTDSLQMTDSGYQYKSCVDEAGEPAIPGDMAFVHIKVIGQDSVLFDSRAQGEPTPLRIPEPGEPRDNLAPVRDVLSLMSEGDSLRLTLPIDSMKFVQPGLEKYESLVYDIKVEEIMTPDEFTEWRNNEMKKNEEREAEIAEYVDGVWQAYKSNEYSNEIIATGSGLKYVIHEHGEGDAPQPGQVVTANYYGVVAEDGSMFDNSFKRGQSFQFQVGMGQVIQGWDEGFMQLRPGTKATLFIPSDLGYGDQGSPPVIPPGAELIFYVELVGVD